LREDVKRELEGLRDDTSEKTEALIEDLLEEGKEGSTKGPVSPVSKNWKGYLVFVGIFLILFSIGLGLFFLWNLIKAPYPKEVSKEKVGLAVEAEKAKEVKKETEKEVKEIATLEKEKGVSTKGEGEKKYNYHLKLANFLFPLEEKAFLKVDVYLYFESYDKLKRAQSKEFDLRRFFHHELKKVEISVWRREDKLKDLEEKLRVLIKKENLEVSPERLELEGVILKT